MTSGAARALPAEGLLGIDGRVISCTHPWTEWPELVSAFQNSAVPLLSYPGRQLADSWDWRTGWVDPNPALTPLLPAYPQSLQKISNRNNPLLDQKTVDRTLLFTPSLAGHNLRLNGQANLAPVEAAIPALEYTLTALADAGQQNIRMDWIELGNAWSETTIWQNSLGQRLFDGSADLTSAYPLVAAQWSKTLRLARPAARIAFHGASFLTPPADQVVKDWNLKAWQVLAQENTIDAMAMQLFLPANLGVSWTSTSTLWGSASEQADQYQALHDPQILAELFTSADQLLARYLTSGAGTGFLQTRFQLIISAFNLADPIGTLRHTWAHGLAIAAVLNAFLREPRVALAVLHNLIDLPDAAFYLASDQFIGLLLPEQVVNLDDLNNSVQPYTLAPAGRVAALFAGLMTGMQTAIPLIASDPSNSLLWGWLFVDNSGTHANLLLANLTPATVWVNSEILFQALSFMPDEVLVSIWQAEPGQFITGPNRSAHPEFSLRISQDSIPLGGQFALPPYSLSTARQLAPPRSNQFYLPLIHSWRSS